MLFYDGHCGLCHAIVRFVIARDRAGTFRFAPLGGETFLRQVPAERRANLPESVILLTARGEILTQAAAVLEVMRELGGGWRILAGALGVVPSSLLDLGYRMALKARTRLFARPPAVCPPVAPHLRNRFDP